MQRVTAMTLVLMASTAIIGLDQVQARPAKCLDSRYIVSSGPLLPGEGASNALIVGADGKVSLAPCGLGKGKAKSFGPKASPKGDKLVITWPKCAGARDPRQFKKIKLNATIAPDCSGISNASIKGKNVPKTTFGAGQSTGCGDGLVDGGRGEACEGGGCPAGQVCTSTCACVTTTTTTTTSPTSTTQPTASSTTTTTPTTTTSTVTTTLPPPSGCKDGAPNTVVDAGEECDDTDPVGPPGCVFCVLCGNGVVTAPQETCDDGNLVCGDSCSDVCRPEVCGDGVQTCSESCDDTNLDNTDTCPSDCTIDACTPNSGTSQLVTVTFASTASVAGISVIVDYPEGKLSIPGSGGSSLVQGRISGFPADTVGVPNDLDHALRLVAQRGTPFSPIPAGQLFRVNFETCGEAPAAVAGDFTCTVLSASDPLLGSNVTSSTTCSVTVP